MAASLRRLCVRQNVKFIDYLRMKGAVRTILTDAHKCDVAWYETLHSPTLDSIKFSKFTKDMVETYEDENYAASRIDFEILAYKLNEMKPADFDMVESLFARYRSSNESVPISDSTNHALIRNYVDHDQGGRVLQMIKDRHKYGIFPDPYAAFILMDYFLNKHDIASACAVVYELMLQGDFSHGTSYLMSLYVATRHLPTVLAMDRYTPPPVDPSEETVYIPVKYIRPVVYDDHFDIKDERYLMGKTLHHLGSVLSGTMGRSLQLIGLGLYDKFKLANQLLEKWIADNKKEALIVTEEAMANYSMCLESAPTRDPDAPQPTEEEYTMDHAIEAQYMTPDEKDQHMRTFEVLRERGSKLESERISRFIETRVRWEINTFENNDNSLLTDLYKEWEMEREESLKRQHVEMTKKQAYDDIQKKLLALQAKEEVLTYFDQGSRLKSPIMKGKPFITEELVEDHSAEYVEAPGQRDTGKTKSRKKSRR